MITVARVWHFAGVTCLPERFTKSGPFKLTNDDIYELTRSFDVMFYNSDGLVMALDDYGRKFRTR